MALRVLVTGAAGLIGGEVSARLVARGHRVSALIHRNHDVLGNDGATVAVGAAIPIDVSKPRFGWTAGEAGKIARDHDMLIHCAATTRFDLPDADYRAVNIDGTAHAIELARIGGLALLHISTAYVCGARDGAILESDPLPANGFANGYEASKAKGEALVAASGLRYAIARPSVVLGDCATGEIRTFDTIYAAFRMIAEGHVRHMPARAGATLDFVPIDHVAAGIVALAERMDAAAGGRYNLVSGQPIPVAAFAAAIGAYAQFHPPALVDPEAFDPAALPPRERRLYRRVAGLYSSYFQRDPRFDDARFRNVTGLAPPPTGVAYLRRLIDHCIAVGFLPAADHRICG